MSRVVCRIAGGFLAFIVVMSLSSCASSTKVDFSNVDAIVTAGIDSLAFPGAVLYVAHRDSVLYERSYGRETYDTSAHPVSTEHIFDLASVSKVIGTTLAVMKLVEEDKIDLADPVTRWFPAFAEQGKENITVYNLLTHTSGLRAHRAFFYDSQNPEDIVDSICASKPVAAPWDTTIYSDLGFIMLGKIVEKASGKDLDSYLQETFFTPMGLRFTTYNPPTESHHRVMPTEIDTFWRRKTEPLKGYVHDENAAALGGVSGHAGLFSTAGELGIVLQMLLNGGEYQGKRYLREATIELFTARQSAQSTRALGWDTKGSIRSWAGEKLSAKSFLHTGFTGTSVAVDPERALIVVFLTNRVYPYRSHDRIHRVRPLLHDEIVDAIECAQ